MLERGLAIAEKEVEKWVDNPLPISLPNIDNMGAQLPFTELEAEDGRTNGSIIGPSRVLHTIASESSGRRAVRLSDSGDYLTMTIPEAEQLPPLIRYNIPDTSDGSEGQETISLYINDVFERKNSPYK